MIATIATTAAAVLAGALAADALLWRQRRRRVERSFATVQTSLGPIPCLELGPRHGAPVLLSTGGGSGVDFVRALPWLTSAGYRVIAISRPGYYGVPLSAAPSLEAHADLYRAVLDELGVAAPHVFGVSAGGPSALFYAARHRTLSLTLWSAVTGPYQPNQASIDSALGKLVLSRRGQGLISWMLSRSARWLPRTTMATFLETESHLPKAAMRHIIDHELASAEGRRCFQTFVDSTTPMTRLYPGMMDELHKMGAPWSVDWERIRVPVLAVASSVDKDVSMDHVERVRSALPHARVLVVRAGGHFVWWGEEGESVIRATLEHLAQATPRDRIAPTP
jgi:pimeloyl-ACP methyl ester carboxylesterase